MKQLLIVNEGSAQGVKAKEDGGNVTPYDLSNLKEGSIALFELDGDALLTEQPEKNFGIALGRGENLPAFVIPEVDIDTLDVVLTEPSDAVKFSATFTFPTPNKFEEYTIILVKKGTVPNERNKFSTNIVAGSTNAATEAQRIVDAINNKTNTMFPIKATLDGSNITVEAEDDSDWNVVLADNLTGVEVDITAAQKAIGDKAYIADLAQKCAAGKGFNLLDPESQHIYPGYPEAITAEQYDIFNLHFATGRKAGKQVDERVWQYVHIAVPTGAAVGNVLKTVFGLS